MSNMQIKNFIRDKQFICKECGQIIENLHYGDNFASNSFSRKINKHLKNEHNLTREEYVIKYYYNGERPTCSCGCGKPVLFTPKGEYLFAKYYSCTHVKPTEESREKISNTLRNRWNKDTIEEHCNKLGVNLNELKQSYNDYINYKISFKQIAIKFSLDKRTIIKLWKDAGLIDNIEDFKRLSKRHKSTRFQDYEIKIDDKIYILNLLPEIYEYVKNQKRKFSSSEIYARFNISNEIPKYVFYKLISEENKELRKYIKPDRVSNLERDFYIVLSFYFSNLKIVQQYQIYDKELDLTRFYDFKLGKRILIEIDGEYFHSTDKAKENDKLKDELAKKYNYVLIRISEKNIKNIQILQNIKKIYEENKY